MRPSISLPIRKIASCLGIRLLRRLVSGGMRSCLDCGRGPFAKSALGKQPAGALVARKKEAFLRFRATGDIDKGYLHPRCFEKRVCKLLKTNNGSRKKSAKRVKESANL